MSDKKNFHVELPENLKGKFKSLERKLWIVDTAIAASGFSAGLVCFYLLLFMSDRLWDTPAALRLFITGGGIAIAGWYAGFWVNHWIVNRRDSRVLAAIVQQKHRSLGDRLMSAVDLTSNDDRPDNVSETLCRAAIEQIANETERYNFNQAVATRRPMYLTLMAIFLVGLITLPITYTADASLSSAKRVNPLSGEDRYTFVENGGLQVNGRDHIQGVFYVAKGSEINLNSKYSFADAENAKDGKPFWETLGNVYANTHDKLTEWDKSLEGSLDIGLASTFSGVFSDPRQSKLTGLKEPRFATMKDGSVTYTLPGRSKSFDLSLRVGDTSRSVRIQPLARPELGDTKAIVQYPDYLPYPQTEIDVRGTVFSYLEGSSVMFVGQLPEDSKRSLFAATAMATTAIGSKVQAQKTVLKSDIVETGFLVLDDFTEMDITWTDQYRIANDPDAPWKLLFERRKDKAPFNVECLDIAPEIAIRRGEVESIRMIAEDDYAIRELNVIWKCWKRDGTNLVKQGRQRLATFKSDKTKGEIPAKAGEATFIFNSGPGEGNALDIPEGTFVDIYAAAKDYYLKDREELSLPIRIHVLSDEEHAQLLQDQFKSKMGDLDDLVRREENLENATRETAEMSPEDMEGDETAKKIERQKQEQKDIADKLKQLAKEVEGLAKEALKNPEMDPKDVAKMAEMTQKMQEAANQQMQQAQAALQLAIDQEQKRQENLDEAAKKEQEAKEKLQELQEEAEETAQEMYANTLVKRLRKIAKFETSVAEDFTKNQGKIFGRSTDTADEETRKLVNDAFGYQGIYTGKAQRLQEEIAAFYDATDDEEFGRVVSAMENYKPVEQMEGLEESIRRYFVQSTIIKATELAKKFNEWADIIDPQNDNDSPPNEGEGQPGEQDEDMIARLKELLRLRQAEMDLREKTLRLDAEAGIKDHQQLEDDAFGLQFRQLELLGDLQKERDERGDGEFLPAAQFRMRDAEDELNLQGDEEGLEEAYKWALVAKASKGGAKAEALVKKLEAKLKPKQIERAKAQAKAIK